MSEARAVALSLLALAGAFAVAAPASVAGPSGMADAPAAQADNGSGMGSNVSAFMQATTGQADEEVESGMWNAAYENASNRTAVVQRRLADIDRRLADLQDRRERLQAARENGSVGEAAYEARMSRLVGRMAALNRSIEETERQASETGVDRSRVERLRRQAGNVTGQEMAAVARSMAGGPPSDGPASSNRTGPPAGAGPPNGTERGPPNGTERGPPNGTDGGPPDRTTGPPNGTGDASNDRQTPRGNGTDGSPPGDGERGNDGDRGNDGQGNEGNSTVERPVVRPLPRGR
jgi:hypothetical protein